MIFKELSLRGVFEVYLVANHDDRGFFMRAYDNNLFESYGIHKNWVQENQSFSKEKGTIRGLHFQRPPNGEAKLVRVLTGEAFFPFVDLRAGSPTFGKWESVTLSEENAKMLFVPRGFALGMCTLADNTTLYYKMDNYYSPESGGTIKWNDSDLGIIWPVMTPSQISEKDLNAQGLKDFIGKYGDLGA